VNDRKIRTELGWRPRRNLAEGLAETVAWYRDNPDRWRSAEDPD
jgi:dTDP-glucose 4,6-dehydratase